jgi:hypothetical protein
MLNMIFSLFFIFVDSRLPWGGNAFFSFRMECSIFNAQVALDTQACISRFFWASTPESKAFKPFNTTPYFRYYAEQCSSVYHVFGGRIPLATHQEVVDLAQMVLQDLPRPVVRAKLATRYPELNCDNAENVQLLDGCIDLVTRLTVMLDIGQFPRTHTGRACLHWTDGSLKEFLQETFTPQTVLSHDRIKLGSQFTARNLELIAGLEVEMTTNLADHLVLREEDSRVLIFHHASFLKNQQR